MLLNFDYEKFPKLFPAELLLFSSRCLLSDCRGRVLKKDCRGDWKTSSTCCCWWCTKSEKCAADEWEKAPILLRISFRFFRSTLNKSYTSSSGSISIVFCGVFFFSCFIVFRRCLRNALIVRKNRNIMLYGQRLLICLNIHYRFSFFSSSLLHIMMIYGLLLWCGSEAVILSHRAYLIEFGNLVNAFMQKLWDTKISYRLHNKR